MLIEHVFIDQLTWHCLTGCTIDKTINPPAKLHKLDFSSIVRSAFSRPLFTVLETDHMDSAWLLKESNKRQKHNYCNISVLPNLHYQNEKKTRSFLIATISWKLSSCWLQLVVHFGTTRKYHILGKLCFGVVSGLFLKTGKPDWAESFFIGFLPFSHKFW